tara:strand:- start:401 stop:589 length:189 start_codon:yes stop_codon:yes gene_type:complete
MKNDTSRHINNDGYYTCSIRDSTFICYHNIDDAENNVKITITITEEGNTEEGNKGKEETKNE